jgi:hypothetical protein
MRLEFHEKKIGYLLRGKMQCFIDITRQQSYDKNTPSENIRTDRNFYCCVINAFSVPIKTSSFFSKFHLLFRYFRKNETLLFLLVIPMIKYYKPICIQIDFLY